jgi:hypothetical protein
MPRDVLVTLAGLAIVFTALTSWYRVVAQRDAALSVEVQRLEKEWTAAAVNLDETRQVQGRLRTFLDGAARVENERGSDRWSPALRSIAITVGPDVELWSIHVWKDPEDNQGRLLHIEGAVTGAAPRLAADKFLRGLKEELMRQFRNAERTKIERIDETEESQAGEHRVKFAIGAPIGAPIAASTKN